MFQGRSARAEDRCEVVFECALIASGAPWRLFHVMSLPGFALLSYSDNCAIKATIALRNNNWIQLLFRKALVAFMAQLLRCCALTHTTIYVSSCRIYEHAVKVEGHQALPLEVRHTTYYIYYICVLILLCMLSKLRPFRRCCFPTYVSSYCYICILILLYMCPHTTTFVSSYYYTCVFQPGCY